MKEIKTQIEINTEPAKIWEVLMDFDEYPEWNPFVVSIIGKPKLRERLKITISPEPGKHMIFKPRITMLEKSKKFAWLGQLFMTGLFDGHHIFELKSNSKGSTTFIQREEFSGFLVPFLWKGMKEKTTKGFESMNQSLKNRVETTN